jgi:hypothetical protein
MSNTTGKKWEMKYIYTERKYGTRGFKKLTTKYAVPKARKRDIAQTTNGRNRDVMSDMR